MPKYAVAFSDRGWLRYEKKEYAVALVDFNEAVRLDPKLDGAGDITADRLWQQIRGQPQRVGSGIIVGEHVFILEENRATHCYELKTGKELWTAQVKGRSSSAPTWSSMVHADGRLYVLNRQGETLVFAAGPKYELLAVNRLFESDDAERTDASLALSEGEWFIRTWSQLYRPKVVTSKPILEQERLGPEESRAKNLRIIRHHRVGSSSSTKVKHSHR